jgi:DNA primase
MPKVNELSFVADLDLKERVRSAVDIVDVIGSQMELRRQGANFVARCPWHDDRRPSLMVNQARQTWKCWVCDIGGDIFSYVMRRDGVAFPEALKLLAEQAGIPIEGLGNSRPVAPGSVDDKATLMAAMRWAVDQYAACLQTSSLAAKARDYIDSRGISADSREKFRIGYAPDSWDWLLDRGQSAGFSGEILHACGLAVPRKSGSGYYDMFRDRVMFPIFDLQGRPVSLGGRVLPGGEDKGGKYINGPETRLFSKSRQLYGLNFARDTIVRQGHVMVMEGYTDVIAAVQAGIEPVVAVLGTALGQKHIDVLKRFAETVVLVLDGDAAGQRRADEVLELFVGAEVDLRVLTLPESQDPADFINQSGADAFLALVERAPDAIDHKLQNLIAGVDLTHDTHRSSKAIETMLQILAKSPAAPGDLKLQQTLIRLARTFMMPQQHLEKRLADLRRRNRQATRHSGTDGDRFESEFDSRYASDQFEDSEFDPTSGFAGAASDLITDLDRELFETLIEAPHLVGEAVEIIDPRWLSSASARELLRAYQSLELHGLSFEVNDCMLTIENEALKNQLVALDERALAKSASAVQPVQQRFESIVNRYRERPQRIEVEQRLVMMDQGTIPEDEALAMLDELFAAQRLKHGLVELDPTDEIDGTSAQRVALTHPNVAKRPSATTQPGDDDQRDADGNHEQ